MEFKTSVGFQMRRALRRLALLLDAGLCEHMAAVGASERFMAMGVGMRLAVAALRERRIDHTPLLTRLGLQDIDLEDSSAGVPCAAEAQLIEAAAEASGDPAFGLHLSIRGNPRETHLAFLLLGPAPSLRETVGQLPRYMRTVNESQHWSVTHPDEDSFSLELRYSGVSRGDLKHTTEFHVAECLRYLRDVAGYDLSPVKTSFAHPRATEISMFERFFRCPVEFSAEWDRMVFSTNLLGAPIFRNEPSRARPPARETTARRVPERSFIEAVVEALFDRLPMGDPTAEAVAKALGVTPDSLFRRLADDGTRFPDVLETVRKTLAIQYLGLRELGLDQIALLLGYDEAESFGHAFLRWTGVPPCQARRLAAAP